MIRAELRPVWGKDPRPWATGEGATVADALRALAAESEFRQGAIKHAAVTVVVTSDGPS